MIISHENLFAAQTENEKNQLKMLNLIINNYAGHYFIEKLFQWSWAALWTDVSDMFSFQVVNNFFL